MIYVMPHFRAVPYSGLCISTTNSNGEYRELSPFVLPAPPAQNFENLWQFSKVYSDQVDKEGNPNSGWFWWRREGFSDTVAHRYPKGKGAIPLYSIYPEPYDNRITEKIGYIDARKKIYVSIYGKCVLQTRAFKKLRDLHGELSEQGSNLVLLDYDAYDHRKLGMSLVDVINEPKRKMGHAFVLMMLLTNEFDRCVSSPTVAGQ